MKEETEKVRYTALPNKRTQNRERFEIDFQAKHQNQLQIFKKKYLGEYILTPPPPNRAMLSKFGVNLDLLGD